jgi:hypothetical protein
LARDAEGKVHVPDFVAQFLQNLRTRREEFLRLLDDNPQDEIESALREAVVAHWHADSLPSAFDTRQCYAVDGSDAMRSFDNGTFLVVSHALLAGPDLEQSATSVVIQRDTLSSDSRERLRGLLTRSLEVGLALEQISQCAGGTLYLDGSIYAELGHLIYPYEAAAHAEVPLITLERYLDLFEACRQHRVRLIAISKTTRGHLLAHALLNGHNGRDPRRWRDDVNTPNDGEVLARWTRGTGQTAPVLVGLEAFGDRAAQLLKSPGALVRAFEQVGADPARCQRALERLRALPAVWASYVRLDPFDDCIRVEALADELMPNPPTLMDFPLQIATINLGRDIVAQVVGDYSSLRVYNTGLYVADRMVRLPRHTVDEKYLPLLRQELGVSLRLNRSERRFH